MKVLFIQQDHVSPTGPVGEAFVDRGYDLVEFLVVPADRFHEPAVTVDLPDPESFDVIVPMGAPWSIYDHETIGTWVHDEIEFLRRAHQADIPILGICFGAQALAAALGGAVIPSERPEVGWTVVDSDDADLVPSGPWFQWHGDRWVLPDGMHAFARTDVAEQAFTIGRSLAVQFHPELTPSMLEGWLSNGGEAHAATLGIDADRLRRETEAEAAAAGARARTLVHAFLDRVAARPAAETT